MILEYNINLRRMFYLQLLALDGKVTLSGCKEMPVYVSLIVTYILLLTVEGAK